MTDVEHDARPRLAVRVTGDALRQIRGGHPWVYQDSIESVSAEARTGDLAVIFDAKRKFAAIGLYDAQSPLRIRILHAGKPMAVDAALWSARARAALQRREVLLADGQTDGWRWLHGENDQLPGVVVDRYARTSVVKLYTAAWLPYLDALRAALHGILPAERTVLRWARTVGDVPEALADGAVLDGTAPDGPVIYREHGLCFGADVIAGQKTGAFLDQRDNRRLVGAAASGAAVLDVFCATGGFSVFAAAGGARQVTSVDVSPGALATAQANMALNGDRAAVAACEHRVERGDAFAVMRDLAANGRRFGIVVVDPPSMARRAAQLDGALRAYADLVETAARLLEPGGLLVQASCTARVSVDQLLAAVQGGSQRAGVELRVERTTGHPVDHPIGFAQGGYLKAVFARRAR